MKEIQDDRGYNQVWKDSEATRIRASRRCDKFLGQMDRDRDASVLEIGCGLGSNAYQMAIRSGFHVLATDLSPKFIEDARLRYQNPRLEFRVLDFNDTRMCEGMSFDYIVGNGILHHLYHDLDRALVNIRRLLKKGGKMVFYEPNLHNPYIFMIFSFAPLRRLAYLEPAEMAFSKGYAIDKLTKAGFRDIHVEHSDFLLPGIPEILIKPSIKVGDILERCPGLRNLAQSIFIRGTA